MSNGELLLDPLKILFRYLHIKLGLKNHFVIVLNNESLAIIYLQGFFPKLSEAKVKDGVFVGPQIKKIIECKEFLTKLTRTEKKRKQICCSGLWLSLEGLTL